MLCPLCETHLVNKQDDYYFICDTCGAYVKDKAFYITNEQEKRRYQEHNNDVYDEGYRLFTSPITNAVLETFGPKHLGLDYGCGTNSVISFMLKQKGFNVKLYDPYFYPDDDYLNYKYDYIFSCEVFEHFHHPKKEIEKLLGLLKSGGYLFIMTHLYNPTITFKNWYYRNDATHVFIYTLKTIKFIATTYNLTLKKQNERMVILVRNF